MKKFYCLVMIICLFLAGCGNDSSVNITSTSSVVEIQNEEDSQNIEELKEDNSEIVEKVNEEILIDKEFIEELSTEKEVTLDDSSYENITLAFTGDTYLSDELYNRYVNAGNNVTGFLSEKVANNFKNVDIMVSNHEYVATDLPDSARDTRQLYNFKAPTNREYLWNEMGVDVLSLANNHAMDYGEKSLFDTIETLDSLNLAHIGAGRDLEDAKKAYITEINGKKIGILAACRFIVDGEWYATEDTSGVLTTYDTTPYFGIVKEEISRLKNEEKCDFVIIR